MKYLFYLLAFTAGISVHAQIVNSDFENWYTDSTGKARLSGWEHLVKYDFQNTALFATWKEVPAEHGQYALKLSRWYNYTWDVVRQKSAISFKPGGLSGYYKYTDNNLSSGRTKDTALLEMYLTRWNNSLNRRDTLGTGSKELSLSLSFSTFSCLINYVASGTPDSILIRFQPSKFIVGGAGVCADSNYCSYLTVDNLSLDPSTGIQPSKSEPASIYPNPMGNTLFLDLNRSEPYTATVTDVLGGVILRKTVLPGHQRFDVSSWKSGMYFLSVRGRDFSEVLRLQKL